MRTLRLALIMALGGVATFLRRRGTQDDEDGSEGDGEDDGARNELTVFGPILPPWI